MAQVTQSTKEIAERLGRMVDTDQAAEIIGVAPGTLIVWRSKKRYPLKWLKIGRSVRYRIEDIEAFLSSCAERAQDSSN